MFPGPQASYVPDELVSFLLARVQSDRTVDEYRRSRWRPGEVRESGGDCRARTREDGDPGQRSDTGVREGALRVERRDRRVALASLARVDGGGTQRAGVVHHWSGVLLGVEQDDRRLVL